MFRHHILDVLGGVLLGLIEALMMAVIWVGPEAASTLVRWISDERTAGSEAEVD